MPRIAQESPKKGLFPLGSFKIVQITSLTRQKILHSKIIALSGETTA